MYNTHPFKSVVDAYNVKSVPWDNNYYVSQNLKRFEIKIGK